VSLDAGRLLGADCAAIVRFQDADRVTILGRWTHDEHGPDDPDATVAVAPGSLLDRLRCGEAMAHDRMDGDYHCERLAAQVRSSAAVWGALVVVASDPHEFAAGAEERLQEYADLIATAVANAEDRARLDREAAVDALTGLPNHRAFRERLAEEVSRAQRHERPLTSRRGERAQDAASEPYASGRRVVRNGNSSSQSRRWSRSRSATSTAGSSRGAWTSFRPYGSEMNEEP
jgi:GAF domain-containing protein